MFLNYNYDRINYMKSSIKQIYVSLELGEDEIKVLVGEYFNTRFNILKLHRVKTQSLNDFKIINREQLITDIKVAIDQCSDLLGSRIEQVILLIPAYNFKRFSLKSSIVTDNGILNKQDIARAVSNSLKVKVDNDVIVINAMISKYNVNNISTRRFPENEHCDEVSVDIDLLCADKEMTYEYISAVEESGVKVLDICLNTYAICKEGAFFGESLKNNVIVLDINSQCTYLTLLSKGKLMSTEVIFEGLDSLVSAVYQQYNIPKDDIRKLIKYNVNHDTEFKDDVVYAWIDNEETKTISAKQIQDGVEESLNNLSDKLVTMCKPIIDQGAGIVVTGQGQQMQTLIDCLSDKTDMSIRSYYPDTLGVRDSSLTALYGSFFVYKEKVDMQDINVDCIDLLEFENYIAKKQIDSEGETITAKIKNLFKQYIDKGEE